MHHFRGMWISTEELAAREPRNVFHRQLEPIELPPDACRNCHVLFRRRFRMGRVPSSAHIYVSADDYYKLYINGRLAAQGPAPSYHTRYNYNVVDIAPFLKPGDNLIAVHTLYQGLINRVWQSGDHRHGLLLDMELDGRIVLWSNEGWKTAIHTAYSETGVAGYDTQFLERYDSRAATVGFERDDYIEHGWRCAHICVHDDHRLVEQKTPPLTLESIEPTVAQEKDGRVFVDFGGMYVGYLALTAEGAAGDTVIIRQGQELTEEKTVRYDLRANCRYEEEWILADGESRLDQYDYKSFRYAEILLPPRCRLTKIRLLARHYPFSLRRAIRPSYADDPLLCRIFDLCVRTQRYGVQEVIQDCMEREKGFYVGDGCYTALTHYILTGDDRMVRKLIDDAFASAFITEGLVTCLNCSFMQEIAEYPLILVSLVLWHYRLSGDGAYLAECYPKLCRLLDHYRSQYEHGGLLSHLDKWCVVEWPKNFRDGYDVDITEGKVCEVAHVAINAYYIEAINTANKIAAILGLPPYRETRELYRAFREAFYDPEAHLFRDSVCTEHKSLVGNVFAFAFGLCPDAECKNNILAWLCKRGISSLSMFCTFPAFMGVVRAEREDLLPSLIKDGGAWLRILREGGTATFEGWGADTKWNTSLFHLTLSYGAVFLSDTDLSALFA